MAELVYVDNSNVFIEGQRLYAVKNGMVMNIHDAIENRTFDHSYRLDFGRLHEFLTGGQLGEIKRAILFGSRPPPNDSLWSIADSAGFEVVVEDRNAENKEKRVDTGLSIKAMADSFELADPQNDVFTIVSGDSDYIPLVEDIKRRGYKVRVAFWSHASRELKEAATEFIELDHHIDYLAGQ